MNNLDFTNEENIINKLYCLNCGKKGHAYKKCIYPIISLGIICIKLNIKNINFNDIINYSKKIQNNYLFSLDEINKLKKIKNIISKVNLDNYNDMIQYLMIQRKNSLNYIEFIRGKYDLNNINYLENIFNLLSVDEKDVIRNNDFDKLWNDLWDKNKKENKNEYNDSKIKFNKLKKGFYTRKNDISIYYDLDMLINNQIFNYEYPEWGFPKGRRNLKEKNVDCAKREFQEETNLEDKDYYILNMLPLDEVYLSTNNSKYKHIYYIGQYNSNKELLIDDDNINQQIEVGDIRWLGFDDSIKHIRDYNIEKKTILCNLHKTIKSTIGNFKNILNDFLEFL